MGESLVETTVPERRKNQPPKATYQAEPPEFDLLLQVPKLITPLRDDTQSILQEGNDDQTPGYGWNPRLDGLRVAVHQLLYFIGDPSDLDKHFVERSTVGRCTETGVSDRKSVV